MPALPDSTNYPKQKQKIKEIHAAKFPDKQTCHFKNTLKEA